MRPRPEILTGIESADPIMAMRLLLSDAARGPETPPAGAGATGQPGNGAEPAASALSRGRLAPYTDAPAAAWSRIAPWYARHRPPYPSAAHRFMLDVAGLGTHLRVLDLGCGAGEVALALAGRVREVVGLDTAPGMLAEAARRAAAAGLGHRTCWRQGAAEDPDAAGPGTFDLVVIADALGYMDAAQALTVAHRRLTPGGAIVVANRSLQQQFAWQRTAAAVTAAWFGPAEPEPPTLQGPDLLAQLTDTGFGPGIPQPVTQWLMLDLDQAVGVQYTRLGRDPGRLGGQWPAYETELRTALAEAVPDGQYPWGERTDLLAATRTAP
ncbi:class I SAM-dependent methyltransferase [Glycomyces sp. NPDC047369]